MLDGAVLAHCKLYIHVVALMEDVHRGTLSCMSWPIPAVNLKRIVCVDIYVDSGTQGCGII